MFRLKIGKTTIFEVKFFFSEKKLIVMFFAWNLPGITMLLQLFRNYFRITVKGRKEQIFHGFFDFWLWSRNRYVMIATV